MIARKRFFGSNLNNSSSSIGEGSSCCDLPMLTPIVSASPSPSPPPSTGRLSPSHRTQSSNATCAASTSSSIRQRVASSSGMSSSCVPSLTPSAASSSASTPACSPIKRVSISVSEIDGMGSISDYYPPLSTSKASTNNMSAATSASGTAGTTTQMDSHTGNSSFSSLPPQQHPYHHQDGGAYYLNNDYHQQPQHPYPSNDNTNHLLQALAVVCFLVLASFGVYMQESNIALEHALRARDHEIDHHLNHLAELEKHLTKLNTERTALTNHIIELEQRPVDQEGLEAQRKLFHLEHSSSIIQQGIQANAKRMVQEKFGKGPLYYVEMTLAFPQESNIYEDPTHTGHTLFLETAPLQDMPHAVHLFLEQVSHGLYNGAVFFRNAQHVLQAGPGAMEHVHTKFRKHPSLNSVLFQEYSPNYPHTAYTVGYPGRPGGPDFYINLLDSNTRAHGPGGQGTDDSAEPCFAKVVAGQSLVDRMHRAQVGRLRGDDNMVHPITIANMKVISHEEYLHRRPIED